MIIEQETTTVVLILQLQLFHNQQSKQVLLPEYKFCAFISVLRFRIVALGTDSRKRPNFQFLTRLREHRRQFPAVAEFESHPMQFSTTDVIGSSHTDTFSNLGYSANTPITGSEFQSLRNFYFCLLS